MAKRVVACGPHAAGEVFVDDRDRFRFRRIAAVEIAPCKERRSDGLEVVIGHNLVVRFRTRLPGLDAGLEFEPVGDVPSDRARQRPEQDCGSRSDSRLVA